MDKHTPTPWKLGVSPYYFVSQPEPIETIGISLSGKSSEPQVAMHSPEVGKAKTKEDAAFIVRAVNCHEELVEVVKLIQRLAFQKGNTELMRRAKQAIAKAEGK